MRKPAIIEHYKIPRNVEFGIRAAPAKPNICWIGTDDDFYPNRIDPRTGAQYGPEVIVCHVMSGTLAGTDSWFNNPTVDVSTTFGIGLKGEIHQYVDIKDGAWGNGDIKNPTWTGFRYRADGSRVNPNLYTVSIEFEGKHGADFWAPTEAQVQAAIRLIAWLCWEHKVPCNRASIIGHYELNSVDRPHCPGPKFPFDRILSEVKQLLVKEVLTVMFTDVKGHWAEQPIKTVSERKTPQGSQVMNGIQQADGTFKFLPNEPVTRAQLATVVSRLLEIIDNK